MSGIAKPGAWRLRGPLGPPLRRGFLVSVPVGIAILVDLEIESGVAGAISMGAMLAAFVAFDAPGLIRMRWQLAAAPVIGLGGAVGALTAEPAWLAVLAIAVAASLAGLLVAVTPRAGIAGMTSVLAVVLAQGLSLDASDALEALALGAAGAGLQVLTSLLSATFESKVDPNPQPSWAEAVARIRATLDLRSTTMQHALRWGGALGLGTGLAHVIDLGPHGYWIPLTVLFVLKPTPDETVERIAMRAVGTVIGLGGALLLAEVLGHRAVALALAITVAAAFAFALLATEYALFTAAVTVFVVLLVHGLGEPTADAVDQRALGTAIGIGVAALATLTWARSSARPAKIAGRASG